MDDDPFDYVAPAGVPSPCVGICDLDPADDVCRGCGRTIDEIAEWGAADDARRRAILERIARRG